MKRVLLIGLILLPLFLKAQEQERSPQWYLKQAGSCYLATTAFAVGSAVLYITAPKADNTSASSTSTSSSKFDRGDYVFFAQLAGVAALGSFATGSFYLHKAGKLMENSKGVTLGAQKHGIGLCYRF